jgi:MSHA pilin protein MshC
MNGERTEVRSPFSFVAPPARQAHGFSLVELIAVLVIMAVVYAVAAPKLSTSGYSGSALENETLAALRYAQRSALSMQRTVCVTFTATSVSLAYVNAYGTTTCGATVPLPAPAGPTPYTVTATGSAKFSPVPTSPMTFDRIGKPNPAQTITLNDGRSITVEAESGFVH